ncbi:MAG TPA: PAC2 family protein [Egibacteraceae bacterium]|nr:PAC2 family protein [Egibacteraceae bacterium]
MGPLVHWVADPPALRRPVLIVSMEGFVDAGAVAAAASLFLRHRWQSTLVARFDRDALLDYRARRPTAVVDSGEVRRVEWPELELYAATVDGARDALLLVGPEPDMAWQAFFDAVADACARLGVELVVGLGAYPAAVPHTRPVRILQAGNSVAGATLPDIGKITSYTGPVGAGTALQARLGERGIAAAGLWAEVPHYVAGSPNPTVVLALVRAVLGVLGTAVDTTELEAATKLHREQIDEAVTAHPEAAGMVAALERHVDAGEEEAELASGEDIAAEIERFLRQQD